MSAVQSMDHTIVMHQYGPPTVLTYTGVSRQPLKPDEVRIRSMASAINHTDLEIRAESWPGRTTPAGMGRILVERVTVPLCYAVL